MFEKVKDLYKFQQQAKTIKKELKNTHIESTEEGIVAIIDGEPEVIDIQFSDESWENKESFKKHLIKALNKALKKSREIGAEKMKGIMGPGFPGL